MDFFVNKKLSFYLYLPAAAALRIFLDFRAVIDPFWLPLHDTLVQFTEFLYAISAYQNGELPLWNSYLYGGQPFYFLLNHGQLLNPIMWIWVIIGTFLKLPHKDIFVFYHLTDIIFYALGGMYLVREITKNGFAALTAYVILLFSGEPNYWMNQVFGFSVIEYVPWILYFGIRYFTKQSMLNALTLSVFTGISLNIYYPFYLVTFMATLLLMTLVFYFSQTLKIDLKKLLKHLLIATPVMALLVLPTYLNYSEITNDNYQLGRFKGTDQQITYDNSIGKESLIVSGGSLRSIFSDLFIIRRSSAESIPLIGILALVFSLLGLSSFSRRGLLFLTVFILMCLNYAPSKNLFHYVSFHLLPLYKLIRSYGFFSGYITLTATVLACIGVQDFFKKIIDDNGKVNKPRTGKKAILFPVIFTGLIPFLPHGERLIPLLIAFVLSVGLFTIGFINKYTGGLGLFKHILIISFLVIGGYNLSIVKGFRIHNATGKIFSYDDIFHFKGVRPEEYDFVNVYVDEHTRNTRIFYGETDFNPSMNECCMTFYHIAEKKDAPWYFDKWGSYQTLIVDREYYKLSQTNGFDRLMESKVHFFKYYTVMDKIEDYKPYLRKSVLILDDDKAVNAHNAKVGPKKFDGMPEGAGVFPLSMLLLKKTANTISFELDTKEDMFMLYTDLYHKGFRAIIDGRKAPILKGMGLFKAIEVPDGKHKVEFDFAPFYRYPLLLYIAASICFLFLMAAYGIYKLISCR